MIKNINIMIKDIMICKSWFSKIRGLMFSRKRNLVLVFDKEKRIGLHMFFVFYPIDVYFLDSGKRVVEIKRNFRPFSFYISKNKAKYAIELVEKNEYKISEKINF